MVFVHYKQANKLQKLLAKHHCPELLEEPPTEANVATENRMEVYLRLQKGEDAGTVTSTSTSIVVKLDEWLHEKSGLLESSLQMKKDISCQAKTRHMEDDLFACPDQAIKVTSSCIKSW